MDEKKRMDYFQKAAIYDLLACYYKYTNPAMHVYYYQKHLKSLNKGVQFMNQMNRPAREARVRVIHAAPGAPNVDIYVNGQKVLTDFPFKHVSDYLSLAPGKYQIDVYPTGNMTESVISKKISVESGRSYTLAAIHSEKFLRLLAIPTDSNVPANETKIRFVHLSPDAPAVDIAVKNGDVVFPHISYRKTSSYLGLTPMTVDLEARVAGTKDVALSLPKMRFEPNRSYTLFAVGYAQGEPALEVITVPD